MAQKNRVISEVATPKPPGKKQITRPEPSRAGASLIGETSPRLPPHTLPGMDTHDDGFLALRSVTFTYGFDADGEPSLKCDWEGAENVVVDAGMKFLIKGYLTSDEASLLEAFNEGWGEE